MSPETAEAIQLTLAIATMPVALAFIVMFGWPGERWYRSWFGISLMLIAIAVLGYTLTAVLFRLFGPGYWGREWLLVSTSLLTFTAMTMRTIVLAATQKDERERRRTPHIRRTSVLGDDEK